MAKQQPITLPLAQEQPGSPFNIRFQLVFPTEGAIVRCPAFRVEPGVIITLKPVNGAIVNVGSCSIAEYPEALNTSSALSLPPAADVTLPWPIENTADIWATGFGNDGILVLIQKAQIG